MIFKYEEAPIHGNQQKAVTFSVFSSRNYARERQEEGEDFHFFILKFVKAQKSSEKEKKRKLGTNFISKLNKYYYEFIHKIIRILEAKGRIVINSRRKREICHCSE